MKLVGERGLQAAELALERAVDDDVAGIDHRAADQRFVDRRLPLLPEIAGLYDELRLEAERVVKARVTSATALPAAELETIKAALKKRFGREVEIETAIDASLIGGAVIDAGDVVIDGSLKGKLERLQSTLSQ